MAFTISEYVGVVEQHYLLEDVVRRLVDATVPRDGEEKTRV